jgi:3-hydroxyacyl-[acyl-carrier-protein] dehydratase
MINIYDKIIMNIEEIKEWLPHRSPLLLIDSVNQLSIGETIVTSKLLTPAEPVFEGHFPRNPIYPGVYYIEAIAQSGALLSSLTLSKKEVKKTELGVLTSIEEARFRRPGLPGEKVYYEVSIEKMRGSFVWFKGTASINNEVTAQCKLSISITSKR